MQVQGWVMYCKANNSIPGSGGYCEGQEGGLKKSHRAWMTGKDGCFPPILVLCFSSKFVWDFPGSECHLRGTPSTFYLSKRSPRILLPAGACCRLPNVTENLPGCCPPTCPPGTYPISQPPDRIRTHVLYI